MPLFQAEKLTFDDSKVHEEFALRAVKSPLALKALPTRSRRAGSRWSRA
jgi:hypothetical protein